MSAYMYCSRCEAPLPAPWDLETADILSLLLIEDGESRCRHCGAVCYYDDRTLVVVLAERIDKVEEEQ